MIRTSAGISIPSRGESRSRSRIRVGDDPDCCGWTDDGRLYVKRMIGLPSRVYKLDPETGKRELWQELMPADPAGVVSVNGVFPTPDGRAYVYTYARVLSDLYLVKGIR